MQVLLLGNAAVVDRDRTHALGSARQATVLAVLAGRAGRPVPVERLVDALWGDDPPATARNTLQVHVSALRRLLGTDAIEGGRESYRFRGAPGSVDVLRFVELVTLGREAVKERPAEAARLLRAALSLYRGDLLEGVATLPALDVERERLRRLHATARLARVDADLALGRHLLVVEELIEMSVERPYDEEVVARLVLAHYRGGAQAEALDAFEQLADRLRDDLGVPPGAGLHALRDQVVRHDARLDLAPGPTARWRAPLAPPADRFVGRDALLLRLEIARDEDRVHTLVGPSGVGKTRLATELATRWQAAYPDGAVLVALADAPDRDAVVARLADALSPDPQAVPTDPREAWDLCLGASALVVLDDPPASPAFASLVADLVTRGRSTVLITAPRPLGTAGERIWSVPPLDVDAAVDLLLDRARHAGADLTADEPTRSAALACVERLDRLPLAIELAAPLGLNGLDEMVRLLARGSRGGAARMSFTSSLDRLGADERDLVDLLASARHPLDAEAVDDAGLLESLAPLVRDGLVHRSPGPHGSGLYTLVGAVAEHVRATRGPERTGAADRRLVLLLAGTTGSPRQYLPLQSPTRAHRRRLVALEPVLVHALDVARGEGLVDAAADIALFLPELHYAARGNPPPSGRTDWLLARDDLDPCRRADLLVSDATTAVTHHQPEVARTRLDEALALTHRLGDERRTAVVLAQRAMSQLLLTADLGSDVEAEREAVRLAEDSGDPVLVAATLCLLYPTDDTPDDLADTLARALAAARSADHAGLMLMALANLAMAEIDRGRPAAAAVHAREGAALARDLHHRGLVPTMLELAETGELLAGDRTSVVRTAQSVAHAALTRDLRRLSEALLRFAAGLHRTGRHDEAARARGLYDALLVEAGAAPTASELDFAARWLADVPTRAPRADAYAAAVALAHEVEGAAPAPDD